MIRSYQIGICSVWGGRKFFWVGSGWVNSSHGAPFWCLFGAFWDPRRLPGKSHGRILSPSRRTAWQLRLSEGHGAHETASPSRCQGDGDGAMALAQVHCRWRYLILKSYGTESPRKDSRWFSRPPWIIMNHHESSWIIIWLDSFRWSSH